MFPSITVKDAKSKFGELVRLLRKTNKLTQQELADKLNLSRITIQNLEAGKNATADTMLLMMQHFDLLVDFYQLIEKQIDNNSNNSLY